MRNVNYKIVRINHDDCGPQIVVKVFGERAYRKIPKLPDVTLTENVRRYLRVKNYH